MIRLAAALAALAVAGAAAGADKPRAPAVVSAMPAWSPDGRQIAFASNATTLFTDAEGLDIFVANTDGGARRSLMSNPYADQSPSWSPDGRAIAYWSFGGAVPALYVIPSAGGRGHLVAAGAQAAPPSWSPDGTRLAYGAYGGAGVYVVSLSRGLPARRVADGGTPTWSPDGERIAFLRAGSLYVVAATGGESRLLTSQRLVAVRAVWSPQGTGIAFAATHNGAGELDVVDPDGTTVTKLAGGALPYSAPSWSPDGHSLVYAGAGGLLVVDRDGSAPRQLTRGGRADHDPVWSPRGSRIAFVRTIGPARASIYSVRPDGSGLRRLTLACRPVAGRRC